MIMKLTKRTYSLTWVPNNGAMVFSMFKEFLFGVGREGHVKIPALCGTPVLY
jgi:hypothetical protein